MFSASAIDPATLQACLETDYRVHGAAGFILRVGQASAALLAAHRHSNAHCSVFLTACKPLSALCDAADQAVPLRSRS